jgi:hypothetical protein
VAGFLYKFVGDNKLDHIQGCEHDGITIGKDISKAIKDFKIGDTSHMTEGVFLLRDAVMKIPVEFGMCKGIEDDIKRVEDWA